MRADALPNMLNLNNPPTLPPQDVIDQMLERGITDNLDLTHIIFKYQHPEVAGQYMICPKCKRKAKITWNVTSGGGGKYGIRDGTNVPRIADRLQVHTPCTFQQSALFGTPMYHTVLSLETWFRAIKLFREQPEVRSRDVMKILGVGKTTARTIKQRLWPVLYPDNIV